MDRRSVIQTLALVGTPAIGGCLSSSLSNYEVPTTVTDISTHRPPSRTPTEIIDASLVTEPNRESVSLDTFDPAVQRELLIAITRGSYSSSGDGDFVLSRERTPFLTEHGGATFRIGMPIGHSGPNDTELYDPLELRTTLEDAQLTIEVANTSDEEYELNHHGRPYHGILLAWDGQSHILDNDYYTENEAIVTTEDGVYQDDADNHDSIPGIRSIAPRESITETYIVPEGVDEGATIWMDTYFRGSPQEGRERTRFQTYIWELTLGERN